MSARNWQPSGPTTVLIGLLSLWPIVYFVFFLFFIGYTFTRMNTAGQNAAFSSNFKYVFVVHALTLLLMFALLATYVVHAFNTEKISADKRVLWIVVLFFGSIVAFPIYWYLYMWRPRALAS